MIPALLLWVAMGQKPVKSCPKGEYLTMDGRCLHDQTGESHPAGDGCNTSTCMDPACHTMNTTLAYCLKPDDPAIIATPLVEHTPLLSAGDGVNLKVQSNGDVVAEVKPCPVGQYMAYSKSAKKWECREAKRYLWWCKPGHQCVRVFRNEIKSETNPTTCPRGQMCSTERVAPQSRTETR